jgi:hypothetical protein
LRASSTTSAKNRSATNDPLLVKANNRLANISTLGFTGTDAQVLIAGFVISGSTPKQVLIRAIGPGLARKNHKPDEGRARIMLKSLV